MIPKCICEGDFDGEQMHRSNWKQVCPMHDQCEYCADGTPAYIRYEFDKICEACFNACVDFQVQMLEEE